MCLEKTEAQHQNFRAGLAQQLESFINREHAILSKNYLEEKGSTELSDNFGKKGKAYMRGFKLRENDTEILNHYLNLIENVDDRRIIKWSVMRFVCFFCQPLSQGFL